jgi:hypothetical protein
MPDTLASDLVASVTWLFQDAIDLSTVSDSSNLQYKKSLADGTLSNQADKVWHDQRTLSAGANDDLDLNALVNTLFGSTITINLARVKALLVINEATAAGEDLVLGAAASNPFLGPLGGAAHTLRCEADSCILLVNRVDGWPCTNGSADVLRINNAGAAANTYKIAIIGTSA